MAFPWLAGLWRNCARRRWPAASLPRSAAPRFGAGLARTHYAPGAIAAGSFPAPRSSPARLAASSICIGAGALAYLAAWDVHRARLFGRCERKNSIVAFHRLVGQVMGREPNRSACRVFLIADNGSCHRGRRAADRLRSRWPNIVLVHTPVHASWLNQIEVYFSIVQRKLLTPSDFQSLAELKRNVMAFQVRYQRAAKPFRWTFTRRDLHALLAKLKKQCAKARKLRQRNTSP